MNNAIEAICQSLSEKGQMIKNKVARSIDDLHQQDEVPQRVVLYQKSSPKAKILFVGGMFCLAAEAFAPTATAVLMRACSV